MDPLTFYVRLRMYCAELGASVTSFGRTEKHNWTVGGVPTSLHLRWIAADVVYDAPTPIDVAQAAAAARGLHVIREADHDHISPLDDPH